MHHPTSAAPAAPKSDILLRLENAGIERNDRWLVRNITLDLHRGEIVTLMAPMAPVKAPRRNWRSVSTNRMKDR